MIVLGIDPGSRRIGYGVVEYARGIRYIEAGILPIQATDDYGALVEANRSLEKLLKKFKPVAVGFEKLFVMRNQKTAMRVSETRGSLLLACLRQQCQVHEYTPNEVKLATTGNGRADKKSVEKMVRLTLALPVTKMLDDALDALAVAITLCGHLKPHARAGR